MTENDVLRIVRQRFEQAGLADGRFNSVVDGKKRSLDHDTRWDDPADVPGRNYGIYSTKDDQLVVFDVDDYGDGSIEQDAISAIKQMDDTLQAVSPHTSEDDDVSGHLIFKLTGEKTPKELFSEKLGTDNPVPSWGEVIAKNKYVVGPGSQLDGCTKDWCDNCVDDDGGVYAIKHDRPIASVDAETIIEVLAADPDIELNHVEDDSDADAAADRETSAPGADNLTKAENKSDWAKEDVDELLKHVDPGCKYNTWRNIGYAIHDWDDGTQGKDLFIEWSQCDSWDEDDGQPWDEDSQRLVDDIWANSKTKEDEQDNDRVGFGRLVHEAKENGWSGSKPDRSLDPDDPPNWDVLRVWFADSDVDDKTARRAAALAIMHEDDFLYVDTDDRLLMYHEPAGVFEEGGGRDVKRKVAKGLQSQFSTYDSNEIVQTIKHLTAVDVTTLNAAESDSKLRCLSNGVLDLETRELLDHSPEYRFTQSIPVNYDPDAEPTHAKEFLTSIVEHDDDRLTLEEMMGASLHPDYLKSKFLFLFGKGQNGKGIWFELVSELLGRENVEGRGLHELATERFAKADLHEKLANIGGDIDDRKLQNVGELKRLTSNTDPVTAERKYGQPFKFVNSATLMFAANEPPAIEDQKRSMGRRIVPIRLPYQFVENPDPDDEFQLQAVDQEQLLSNMTTDEELSGVLNLALDGMDRLIQNGDVSLEATPMERLEYYSLFSDPIYRFASECLEKTPNKTVEKPDVYELYKQFSTAEGHGIRHSSVFWREFRRVFHTEFRKRRGPMDSRIRELMDAKMTDSALDQYGTPELRSKYRDDREDDAESDQVVLTNLDDLRPGFCNVEVTVVEKLDPPKWLSGKGHMVDDYGNIVEYQCEGGVSIDAAEDSQLRLKNVKVEQKSAGMTLLLSSVTQITEITKDQTQTGLDDADAAADGGVQTSRPLPPDDAEGPQADMRRILALLDDMGMTSRTKLSSHGQMRFDIPTDRGSSMIDRALERGLVEELANGSVRLI
jgi:P4 family phage/plasmid primase-like protien